MSELHTDRTVHRVVSDVDGQLVCACGARFALVWDWAEHRKQHAEPDPDDPTPR
jgi:hypothetical protein